VSKIISSDQLEKYDIKKFQFGSVKKQKEKKIEDASSVFLTKVAKDHQKEVEDDKEKDKKEFEKLLKKVDDLTGEVVSLQMALEEQKKEYEKKLIQAKEDGYKEGVKDTQESLQNEIEEIKVQYISSITSLQELDLEIKEKLKTFEEELIETSIIIATKVIKKEVEEHSSEIAKSIANYLLSDIKDDLEIKLLVNPIDYEELLKESIKDGVKVVSDNSIKPGGVVILSKEKNLDGTIETRLKKTLQLIKES